MIIDFLKTVYGELKSVSDNVFFEQVVGEPEYPYITYDYHMDGTVGFYVDVHLYDLAENDTTKLDTLYGDLIRHFDNKRILDCGKLLQCKITNGAVIHTDDKMRERWLEIYIKIDWRG